MGFPLFISRSASSSIARATNTNTLRLAGPSQFVETQRLPQLMAPSNLVDALRTHLRNVRKDLALPLDRGLLETINVHISGTLQIQPSYSSNTS